MTSCCGSISSARSARTSSSCQRAVDPGERGARGPRLRDRRAAGAGAGRRARPRSSASPPARGDDEGPEPVRVLLGSGWVVTQHARAVRVPRLLPRAHPGRSRSRPPDLGRVRHRDPRLVRRWLLPRRRGRGASGRSSRRRGARAATPTSCEALVRARRSVARLRRVLVLNREVVAELARPDFVPACPTDEVRALHQVASTARSRAGRRSATSREMLVGTFDIHMTRTAQRTNDIMRVLTLGIGHPPAGRRRGRDHGHELQGAALRRPEPLLRRGGRDARDRPSGRSARRALARLAVIGPVPFDSRGPAAGGRLDGPPRARTRSPIRRMATTARKPRKSAAAPEVGSPRTAS